MRIMRSIPYAIFLIVGLAMPAAAQNPGGAPEATPAGVASGAPPGFWAAAGMANPTIKKMAYGIDRMIRIVLSSLKRFPTTMRQNTNRTPAEIRSPVRSCSNPASTPSSSAVAHA